MPDDRPLILTAECQAPAQAFFNQKRQQHFPPERNHIPAHLTLFHHLPGGRVKAVEQVVRAECHAVRQPVAAEVTGIRFLGFGSAYQVQSPGLSVLRSRLAERFEAWLTRQDQQPFRPHVTFQNKVPAPVAKQVYQQEQAAFEPFSTEIIQLALWRYCGGPWERVAQYGLAAGQDA